MINTQLLHWCLSAPMEEFAKLQHAQHTVVYPGQEYIHIDRGSKILGVAHADSVCKFINMKITTTQIRAATIDNRLGLYMILFGLPFLGIDCDVLITDHEEIGQSTAQYFDPEKEYNWMFSFDRAGTDVVTYQYDDNDEWMDALNNTGFTVGMGAFSDISYLGHLGISGVNVGCGMENYHSAKAYADINELMLMSTLFRMFWSKNKDRRFDHDETEYSAGHLDYAWQNDMLTGNWTEEDVHYDYGECEFCGLWERWDEMHDFLDSFVCNRCYYNLSGHDYSGKWTTTEVDEQVIGE